MASTQEQTTMDENVPIDFCTLGMFIIDDIHPHPSDPDPTPRLDILGGAGTFSAIGARLFSPPPPPSHPSSVHQPTPPPATSLSIAWILDAGPDFPSPLHAQIASWHTSALIRPRATPTTRGWNGYTASGQRDFHYLTPKQRLSPSDLPPNFLKAGALHLICSAERCITILDDLRARRVAENSTTEPPTPTDQKIIWEPVPNLCIPSELPATLAALSRVDICSPNHHELASLLSEPDPPKLAPSSTVTRQALQLLQASAAAAASDTSAAVAQLPRKNPALVTRAGAAGAHILTLAPSPSHSPPGLDVWLPAYHAPSPSGSTNPSVVDPTGGGNAFLGAFAVGWVRTGDLVEAGRWGAVGAGIVVEGVGAPVLGRGGGKGEEVWNGVGVGERMGVYEGVEKEFRQRERGGEGGL